MNTYDWFKEHLTSIEDIENYDPTDKQLAMKTVLEHESLVKGIVYQDTTTPSYESQIEELDESALTKRDIHLSEQEFNDLRGVVTNLGSELTSQTESYRLVMEKCKQLEESNQLLSQSNQQLSQQMMSID